MADMYLRIEFRYKDEELRDGEWNGIEFDSSFWFNNSCETLFRLMGMNSNDPALIRGCPEDINVKTQIDAGELVWEEDDDNETREVLREQADAWVKSGECFYLSKWKNLVSSPEYTQFSWCTYEELRERVEKWISGFNTSPDRYDDFDLQVLGLLEYMRILESNGRCITRAVYWFCFGG